jgi:tryptophan-rich sensory protein
VGNAVWFKQMTNHATNYPFYLSQVINVVYIPIFFGLVAYERSYTSLITADMMAFPKIRFFWMGAADAIAGLLMLFGGIGTAGNI